MITSFLLWMSWIVGPILAYAAIAKTIRFQRFKSQVVAFSMIPPLLAWPITLAVLGGEYILATLFMTGIGTTQTFFSAAGLLAIFTIFVGWVVGTGKKIHCYCFGEDDAIISSITLVRNLVLLGVTMVGGLLSLYQDLVWYWPESILPVIYGVSSGLLYLAAYKLANLWLISRSFI